MVRRIKAIFTDSASGDFDVLEKEVTLLAPDIIVEDYGDELAFRIIDKVSDDQETVEIDLAKCRGYIIETPSQGIEMDDLGTASDITSGIMSAFGLEAEKTGYIVDVLAQAANSSNASIPQLGEAFKYVGPVAKSLGLSHFESGLNFRRSRGRSIGREREASCQKKNSLSLLNAA